MEIKHHGFYGQGRKMGKKVISWSTRTAYTTSRDKKIIGMDSGW